MLEQSQDLNKTELKEFIRKKALDAGFQQIHFVAPDVSKYKDQHWQQIEQGYHAGMDWLERNTELRYDPKSLHSGTKTIVMVRMDYLSDPEADFDQDSCSYDREAVQPTGHRLIASDRGEIARYALGRDYHKLMRQRLSRLGQEINLLIDPLGYRAFVDSAPILERQLAEASGMGWLGKNTLLLNQNAGSWFFLGELFLTLELQPDPPLEKRHCGTCTACMDACPTQAFVSDGVLNSALCISYLTIEHDGPIPIALRSKIGNRIFGCDDCQWSCPFSKFTGWSQEADFKPRRHLFNQPLDVLWQWTEQKFLDATTGTPIRRLGYQRWRRNLAVAIGNSGRMELIHILRQSRDNLDPLVQEHVDWAIMEIERG